MPMSKPSNQRAIKLNALDNVGVAVANIASGDQTSLGVKATDRILRGHKLALSPIGQGERVIKLGQTIGFAKVAIAPGSHVHEHNIEVREFARDPGTSEGHVDTSPLPSSDIATFEGYRRSNGRFGTRNYLGILTSVNCSASVARFIAKEVERQGLLKDYPNVDGVIPLVHGTGCAMASDGEGYDILKRTLWGYAANPNMAGVLMVGLGCEMFEIPRFMKAYGIKDSETFRAFTIQATGGTKKSVIEGVARLKEMLPRANQARRETAPASELMLALQCGGSDGYSGLTANPSLGAAVDLLVRQGGTAILSETPEIYGAEHLLTRRAVSNEVATKLLDRIRWWEAYTARNDAQMNNNPSPGNKAGGLSTILEKSLGAVAKGGTTALTAVFNYAEPVTAKGLVFMDTPGYDPVSATGQVAGGANILAFTTGRGSAYGCKPVPSIKLATNSDVYARMTDDMDINCGDVMEGVSVADKGQEIFNRLLQVASGAKSKSEELGYGDAEFVPWQIGAVL